MIYGEREPLALLHTDPAAPVSLQTMSEPQRIVAYVDSRAAAASSAVEVIRSTAATSWLISHNLNRYPQVMVMDTTRETVGCKIEHLDKNVLNISFGAAMAGTAILT